jgi:hypothetical protein
MNLKNFDELDLGNEIYYIPDDTKTVYLDDGESEESKAVEVWIAPHVVDLAEFMPEDDYTDDTRFVVEVQCVPLPEYLTEDALESVTDGSYEPNIYDIASYGYSVPLWEKSCGEADLDTTLQEAIDEIPDMSGLIGFYLDKPYNRMGDSGWTILEDACLGMVPSWRK